MNGKMRLAVALGALVALAAVTAYGDYNVQDKTTHYTNGGTGLVVNSVGQLLTAEASKDRDKVIKYDNIIADSIAVGYADSTVSILDTHDVGRGYLYIRVITAAGQTAPTFVRMAVRVQACLNAADDSSNTFNIVPRALTGADTLGVYNIVSAPTAVAVAGTEYIVTIGADNTTTTKWGRSHTIVLPLADTSPGGWFWAEYTKVMVRNLTSGMTGTAPYVYVSYRGTPL